MNILFLVIRSRMGGRHKSSIEARIARKFKTTRLPATTKDTTGKIDLSLCGWALCIKQFSSGKWEYHFTRYQMITPYSLKILLLRIFTETSVLCMYKNVIYNYFFLIDLEINKTESLIKRILTTHQPEQSKANVVEKTTGECSLC